MLSTCTSAGTDTHGPCINTMYHNGESHDDGYGNEWPNVPDFVALYNAYWEARRAFWEARRTSSDLELIDHLDCQYVAAFHAVKAAAAELSLT